MKIVACYKLVPEEQDIAVKPDQTLDFSTAEWKIGSYDLNAVEAGMTITDATGGEVLVLSAGGSILDNSKLRKGILSRGPAEQYVVVDSQIESADSVATAKILKAAIEKIGDVDLILCGEGSGDIYSQQVGSLLGIFLGWSTVNAVDDIKVDGPKITVTRDLEDCTEVAGVDLPAVITVTSAINTPRIAGMKDILGAGKKPFTVWNLEDIGTSVSNENEVVSILAPKQADRLKVILEGVGDDNIETLYNYLRKAL